MGFGLWESCLVVDSQKNPTEGGTTKNRNGIKIKTFTIEEMGWARLPLGSF